MRMLRPYKRPYGRHSIRLKGYDYTQEGAYFATICTWQREILFGDIIRGEMHPNSYGRIAQACLEGLPRHFPSLSLDAFVVMPNHVHVIFMLDRGEASAGAAIVEGDDSHTDASPLQWPNGTISGSLGAIVQNFKSVSARKINQARLTPGEPVWQRNYYERIIRNEDERQRIQAYILNNPGCWGEDRENPQHSG